MTSDSVASLPCLGHPIHGSACQARTTSRNPIMLTAPSAGVESPAKTHYNLGYIWTISLVAALGGLLFGYDWVVIGGAKPFFEPYFGIHWQRRWTVSSGWANSCALVGCLFGAMAGRRLSDRFGRKWLLTVSAMIFVVTSIGNALAANFVCFRRLADPGRHGHRSGIEPLAHVYLGNCARRNARPVGLHQSTHDRHRHASRPDHQLVAGTAEPAGRRATDRQFISGHAWYGRMLAMDVRPDRRAVRPVLPGHVLRSGKSALAGQEAAARDRPATSCGGSAASAMPRPP